MTKKLKNKGLKKFYGLTTPSQSVLEASFISKETYERLKDHEAICAFCVEAEKKEDVKFGEVIQNLYENFDYKGRDMQDLPTFRDLHYVEVFRKDGELKARPISVDEYVAFSQMNYAVFCEEAPRFSTIDFDILYKKAERLDYFIVEE